MFIKTTAMAVGLAAVLGAGSALAQPAPQGAPEQGYQGGYQGPPPGYQGGDHGSYEHRHMHHHGVKALIREEAGAGRISQKEAALLMHKIEQMHAEKRAERQARYYGERGAPPQQGQ